MKKILVIILFLLSISMFLTGCGTTKWFIFKVQSVNTNTIKIAYEGESPWQVIDLNYGVTDECQKQIIKLDVKPGDIIRFYGNDFGEWNNISKFEVIKRANDK